MQAFLKLVAQTVASGLVAGFVAFIGVVNSNSKAAAVQDVKVQEIVTRATEDRKAFQDEVHGLTLEIRDLNTELHKLAVEEARLSAERERRQ